MVLAIQPDRLRVQLDRLLVLLGGEVLVTKPGWKFDLSEERNGRRTSKDKKYIRGMKSSFSTQQGNPPAERGHDNNNEGNSTPPIVDFGCMRNAQPKENELETWRDLASPPNTNVRHYNTQCQTTYAFFSSASATLIVPLIFGADVLTDGWSHGWRLECWRLERKQNE